MLQQPEGAGGPCAVSARSRAGQDWLQCASQHIAVQAGTACRAAAQWRGKHKAATAIERLTLIVQHFGDDQVVVRREVALRAHQVHATCAGKQLRGNEVARSIIGRPCYNCSLCTCYSSASWY